MSDINDINDMDYLGEEIRLGGKTRHIKYAIKGLKLVAKKYGSVIEGFNKMKTLNPDFDEEGIDDIVLLLYAGLIHEDKELSTDNIESWLTIDNMTPIFKKMITSFTGSTPQAKDGADETVGEQLP